MANAKRTAMMLLGADEQGRWLRVALYNHPCRLSSFLKV